jgi:magnesium chelatase family protein
VPEQVTRADAPGLALLRDAADAMRLSARGYHRVLRIARTLADMSAACTLRRLYPIAHWRMKCAARPDAI